MANHCMFCLWILLTLSFVLLHGSGGCEEEERRALLRLRDAVFKYPNGTTSLPSWGEEEEKDCCMWEGVKCDLSNRHVIQLSLANIRQIDLTWKEGFDYIFLNTSLFLPFRELRNLSLYSNNLLGFHGALNLSKLQVLDLSHNWFDEIPPLGLLRSLSILNMEYNSIRTWSHFEELATLKGLELLDFGSNFLRGKIPHSLGSFTSLKFLSLARNDLNGTLTDGGFCKLRKLQELDLGSNSFEGRIPSCLGNLTSLRVLVLESNYLMGTLPSTLFSTLDSLMYLSLSFNYFEGSFSFNTFGNNSKLEIFELDNLNSSLTVDTENPPWMPQSQIKIFGLPNCKLNEPAKNLPSFLLKQRELNVLDLSHTGLIGVFPTWLLINNSNMVSLSLAGNSLKGPFAYSHQPNIINGYLSWLDVSMNQIQGVLPYSIGAVFPNLFLLNMSMNAIQGGIPPSLGELTQLSLLDLSNNKLSGELPKEFVQGCINLQILTLANNNLQGRVLPTNSNLSSIQHLRLENNHFSGELSRGLLNSMSLRLLDLSNNSITGKITDWIGYLSQLKSIVLSNNFLQGPIPMSFCKVKELGFLDLSRNKLTKTIPACLDVSSLRYLHLHGNELTGSVPKVLSGASSLVTLDMRDNNLSGRLPSWISSLSSLRFILLGGNQLEGSIPSQFCDLRNISMLDISSNNLSSFLPSCLHKVLAGSKRTSDTTLGPYVKQWITYFPLSTYSYETRLQIDLYLVSIYRASDEEEEVEFVTKSRSESYKGNILNYMSGIDLSFNNFIGSIPHEIGYLSNIHTLNLSHNHFTGSIPTTFSNLKQIECLDLSHNRLNGQIPQELIELNFLSIFSVAFNNLSGRIPDKKQFLTFENSSYEGNPLLCGQMLGKSCNNYSIEPSSESITETDPFKDTFVWRFIASYIVAFIASIIGFLCCSNHLEQLLRYVQAKSNCSFLFSIRV
nr:probable LRR receptor-like serine/threonine-protein kinase At1g34110 [Ipomoea batatas]